VAPTLPGSPRYESRGAVLWITPAPFVVGCQFQMKAQLVFQIAIGARSATLASQSSTGRRHSTRSATLKLTAASDAV
jgi:hypothetical protein